MEQRQVSILSARLLCLISPNGFCTLYGRCSRFEGDGVPQPLSLYYSRSEDGGHTFSDAEPVVDEPVAWREIVTDSKGNLHLLWQPPELTTVWDQVSLDGGHTWQYPQGLPDAGRLAAVTKDSAGRLHLVGVGPSALGHWLWDGSRWKSEAPLKLVVVFATGAAQRNCWRLPSTSWENDGRCLVKPTGDRRRSREIPVLFHPHARTTTDTDYNQECPDSDAVTTYVSSSNTHS